MHPKYEWPELIGKKITCQGETVEIAYVHNAANYSTKEKSCLYIEFQDTQGNTRYWKQDIDGGELHD